MAADFLVGDIFFVLAMPNPAGNPHALPKDESAAPMAWLRRENREPTGRRCWITSRRWYRT